MLNSLTLIMPVYNESEALPEVLPIVLDRCKHHNWELIVVNDGSADNTEQILGQYKNQQNMKVATHKVNRGYGAALKTGINIAETEFIATIDGDGQHQPDDLSKLLKVLLEQDADLIIGSRKNMRLRNVYRSLGKWIIRGITKILLGVKLYDVNSGMKLCSTKLAQKYIQLCPDSMAFSNILTLIFLNMGHLVIEHPIVVHERIKGESTITTRTAFETVLEILNIIMLFNPMKIFLPASILCVLFGIIWGLPIVLDNRGISVGAMLSILTGVMFFFLGLVSEQLSLLRKDKIKSN